MKKYLPIFFTILLLFVFVGCASQAVKHEIVEVKKESPNLKTAVIAHPQQHHEKQEDLNPYAFQHYVYALMLENDQPPDIMGAAEQYKQALQYYPNSYQIRLSLANCYYEMRKYSDVIELLEVIQPEDQFVYDLRGRSYIALGDYSSAQNSFTKLATLDPNSAIAYHYLSQFYRNSGEIDSLIWAYENLTRLIPYNERYWQELGKLKAQMGKFVEAQEAFQKSLEDKSDKTNILSYVGLAEMYKVREKLDSALLVYQAAIAVDPENAPLNADISLLYAQLDSLEQAIPYAKKVTELAPKDELAARRLAIIYYGADSLKQADSIFTSLVNKGEKESINHFYLGRIASQRGDYKIAVDEFTILTQINDTLADNWLDLGYAYRKLDDISREILTYKTGLEKVTSEKQALKLMFALGAVYERANMFDSSTTTFEQIIEKEPDNHQALNYLGYMLADRGEKLQYAKKLIEKAVELSPDNPAYLDSYGWVFYRLEDFGEALKQLKKAVSLAEDSIMYDHLGDVYKAKGDLKNAGYWWRKALDLDPNNEKIKNKLDE